MTAPTLTEFLLARIAEDEAEAASKPADWLYGYHDDFNQRLTMSDMGPGFVLTIGPARVRAECEAKRRIVEWAQTCEDKDVHVDAWCMSKVTLAHLAAVYADHPDYREEWTP